MKACPIKARIRAEGGVTRVDLMDDIGEGLFGGGISAAAFTEQLGAMRGPLDVHISSAGGMVDQGLAIYNALAAYPGPVTTYNDGLAASVASVIMQAGSRRVASPVSALMIHDAWGDPGPGDAAAMESMRAALDKNSDIIARAYANRAGGTVEQWRAAMKATTWYDANEALAAGLVDEIAGGASRPAGPVDLEAVAASAPARIMAALRSAPIAAAAPSAGAKCKTCKGKGRLKHPVTGANSMSCPSCKGGGIYPPAAAQASLQGAAEPHDPSADEPLGDGWFLRGGKRVFDPEQDGDDDSSPETDTDHDYWSPDGKQLKPIPPCPEPGNAKGSMASMSFTELREAMRPAAREVVEEMFREAGISIRNGPIPVHHTPTDDKPFDGPKFETYVQGSPDEIKAKMRAYAAWVDPSKDPGTKAAYKLGHHDISADGKVGDANLNGVRAGLAELGGARGGVSIPDADKAGVTAHLEAHLKDGGGHPGGDHGKNSTDRDVFSRRLKEMRDAMPSLKGAET